jgi:hypothetical protein
VDGSTLEGLRNKTQVLREHTGVGLGGMMMVMVEACSHQPLWQLYTDDAAANNQRFAAAMLEALPVGGLLVLDLGFFGFLWFDDFSNPCQHPLRMVSVRWQGAWYHYRTNVLAPQVLSARQVCARYRCRWQIEEAFALTA